MKRRRDTPARGQALVMTVIVVAIIAAGGWYLFSARASNEKAARDFALHAGQRMFLHQDVRFVNHHLSPQAQVTYPPSWRERMFKRITELGPPEGPVTVRGDVHFTRHFFDAHGTFRTECQLGGMPAYVDLWVSRRGPVWQIDNMNFTWMPKQPPVPPEAETPEGAEAQEG